MLMGNDQKVHFRMYKSGKTWLVAGVVALVLPVVGLTGQAATADSKPDTTQAAKVASGKTTAEKTVTLQGSGSQTPVTPASPKVTAPANVKPEATSADKPVAKVAPKGSEQPKKTLVTPEAQPKDQPIDSQPIVSKPDSSVSKASESKPVSPAEPTKPTDSDTSKVTVSPKPATPAPAAPVVKAPVTQPDTAVTPEKLAPKIPASTSEVSAAKPAPRAVTTKSEQPDVDPNQVDQQVRPATDYADYHREDNLSSGQFGTSEYWVDANYVLHIGAGQFDNTGKYVVPSKEDEDPNGSLDQTPLWGEHTNEVTNIKFEGKAVANSDVSGLFMDMDSLETIDGLDKLDTSQATNMAFMFSSDRSLKKLDLKGLDTSKVTNMQNMFFGLDSLTSLDLTPLDTRQVTSMAGMFAADVNLTQLNVSNLKTGNVVDMAGLFMADGNISTLDLSSFDTSQVQDMSSMFSGMDALSNLNLSSFNTQKVKDMTEMFEGTGADKMIAINLGNFDMEKVDQMPKILDTTPLKITLGSNAKLCYVEPDLVSDSDSDPDSGPDYDSNSDHVMSLHPTPNPQLSGLKAFLMGEIHDGNWYTGKWIDTRTHKVYTTEQLIALYTVVGKTPTAISVTDHNPTATYQQQTNLEVKDSVIHLKEHWKASDNFVSATDVDGGDVTVDNPQITISNQPNTQQLGKQSVTYTFMNADKNVATRQAPVVVTGIALQDFSKQISTTSTWSPRDNVKLAIDAQGNPVAASAIVMTIVDSQGQTVTNFQTPGVYLIHYQIGDDLASRVTIPLTVYSLAAITGKNSAINLGTTWHPSDNFSAIDENGHPLTVTSPGVSVKGQPNVNIPGNYQVTYNYVDASGYAVGQVLTVTVAGIQLKQQNVEATTTDNWQPATNLQGAVNAEGKNLSAADLQIVATALSQGRTTGNALLTVPGTYLVTYRFDDRLGTHQVQTQVKIISKASVVAHDQKIQVGATWQPQAGFVSATDEHGRTLSWDKIKVTGDVDTHRAGRYLVQYSYTDAAGNQTSQATVVTVFDPNTDVDSGGGDGNQGGNNSGGDHNVGGDGNQGGSNPGGDHNVGGGNGNQGGNNSGGDHNLGNGNGNGNQGEPNPDGNHDWNGGYQPQQPDLNQNGGQPTTPVLTRPKPSQPTLESKPASLPQTSETDSHEAGVLIGLTGLVVSGYLALVGRLKRH
ncbi:bacterial Ig-like domain-containing protein [Lactiplantibacillus paraxiangfangensis]|uniref:bacterial Ig-like domain-containing protein n=1 Tax=Lactiplantibacillus paraxiangfangensis TaxID=3076224 RepID=UPI0030C6DD94